ncbi:MAG: PEP-CTERM sorting domain-containing protein [Verrucomicrobiales bacterium]
MTFSTLRTAALLATLSHSAVAGILVTFTYDGTDTIGTVSGSLVLPSIRNADDFSNTGPDYISIGNPAFYVHKSGSPSYDFYDGGSYNLHNIGLNANSWSGSASFGFSQETLYADPNTTPGSTYSPTGVFRWNNRTPEEIGATNYSTPTVIYTASNGGDNTISLLYVVPEPTGLSLLALSALTLLRRKR